MLKTTLPDSRSASRSSGAARWSPDAAAAWRASERNLDEDAEDAQRFANLTTPFLPEMICAAQAILGSEDLAWDAVQETLLRIWDRGWIPDDPAPALIHLVVKSSLHQLRCQRRRNHHEAQVSDAGSRCCEEDPLASAESTEQVRLVRGAIRRLTEEYRTVLELYELRGETYEAIATRLSLPVGTVRSRLSRGRAELRRLLTADFHAA